MIDFMIIGLPRSGTTWAANWFTSRDTYCHHDPLYKCHYGQWGTMPTPVRCNQVGVSCTGIWRWPKFVNDHPARKLILVRDFDEVQHSLESIGAPLLHKNDKRSLDAIHGEKIDYKTLFNTELSLSLWEYLIGDVSGYCHDRHAELCKMDIQPKHDKINPDKLVTKRLYDELNKIAIGE
jgi:hypothetical protein